MDDLRLLLRGMWFRRGISVAVLVIAALVVGGAVTGPLFWRAAGESVLRDTLNQALPVGRIMNDHLAGEVRGRPLPVVERSTRRRLQRLPTLERLLRPPVASLQVEAVAGARGVTPESTPLVYRQGVCRHVHLVAGRCPRRTGTVMVSQTAAAAERWHLGQRLLVNGRPVTVSGVYTPLAPRGDYWAGHGYFAALAGAGSLGGTLDATFASLATLRDQPGTASATAALDRPLDLSRIRLSDLPALDRQLLAYTDHRSGLDGAEDVVSDSAILAVLYQADAINDRLTLPVVVVEVQLLLLCWLILFLVIANGAEARGHEVALAKLRGVPAPVTVAFGLLDTLLLILLAVPLGVALAWAWVSAIAHGQLAPGTPVVLTGWAWLAAVGAGAGAAVAAVLAASRTLRRPVVEQWRRATRRARPRSWVVDLLVGAACMGGLVLLARRGAVGAGRTDVLALVAPGLVVLTAALWGSRALPLLCRAGFGPTRRRGRVGAMLAVRQLARRPSTLRLALVLAVAFGLVTFAIDAWSVARSNQHDRAFTEVGAAEVLTVAPPPGRDLARIVDRLDPGGRQAAAVSVATDYSGAQSVQLLAVQPRRFARVAFWREDFGPAPLRSLVRRLRVPVAPVVALAGNALEMRLDVSGLSAGQAPVLVADVVHPGAGRAPVTLGRLHDGRQTLHAEVDCAAAQACRLEGLHLERPGVRFFPITATLRLHALRVRDHARWRSPLDLHRPGRLRPAGGGASTPRSGPQGLTLRVHAGDSDTPTWQVADRPTTLPALVTTEVHRAGSEVAGVNGEPLPVRPVATGPALPGAGARGVVVDRAFARRYAGGATTAALDTVWLAPSATGSFPQRLRRAGVTVLATDVAARHAMLLARQGPALALLLFLAGAALGALLAAGGTVLSLHLAGRRRTYEIAAMTALGVRPRTLLASLCSEQGLLLVFGTAVGTLAGLVGGLLALPAVPEFADAPEAPPLLYDAHLVPVLGVVGVTVLALLAVIAASSAHLLRAADTDQLREAPA